MSNAELMALAAECWEANREVLIGYIEARGRVNGVEAVEKAFSDISDNLKSLGEGGQLSGGV